MKRALCFEPVSGASGDMILAALLDLGVDPEDIARPIRQGGLDDFDIRFERQTCRHGLLCGRVEIVTHDHGHEHPHEHDHGHEHPHEHGDGHEHPHDHEHGDGHEHPHEHEHGDGHGHGHAVAGPASPPTALGSMGASGHHHRGLAEILEIVARSGAPIRARERAERIFRRLGEAEAAVHGVPVEEVHFHEVGAVDSIVDIFGICLGLEALGVDRVFCTGFKVGRGTVRCAHGVIPVPAPATVRLLQGCTVTRLPIDAELTTPTGAAVLSTLSEGTGEGLPLRLLRVGMGHGRRELEALPNIVRAFLLEFDEPGSGTFETVSVLECDLDDQTGEVTGALTEELLRAGALDVTLTAVQMKKNRPGTRLGVLARSGDAGMLTTLILSRSSTLGVRSWSAARRVLPRSTQTLETPWGEVVCKRIDRPDGTEWVPEFDSARHLADAASVPLRHVLDAARRWEPSGH
ncbi:MAG: LarC family nickel insertion protein [Lentisphaeria bacterium]|nr:LarC family nickel insertion protein [Lentisphaeria bacterium]